MTVMPTLMRHLSDPEISHMTIEDRHLPELVEILHCALSDVIVPSLKSPAIVQGSSEPASDSASDFLTVDISCLKLTQSSLVMHLPTQMDINFRALLTWLSPINIIRSRLL